MLSKLGKRRKAEERVEISDLQFGKDFKYEEAMLKAEVRVSPLISVYFFVSSQYAKAGSHRSLKKSTMKNFNFFPSYTH